VSLDPLRRPVLTVIAAGAVLAASAVAVLSSAAPAVAATPSGTYQAVTPTRILDTRSGLGAPKAAIGPHRQVVLTVEGAGPVPGSGVSAVVVNVTATQPTAAGYLTVYPDGAAKPTVSNLNFAAHRTVPNLVLVRVPSDGKIDIFNGAAGDVQIVADVSGYYTGSDAPSGQGALGTLTSPRRILDTRKGVGAAKAAVGADGSVALTVTGGGVPSGVSAVVLNVTVTNTAAATGDIVVYAHGGARPTASNVNFARGQTVANLVLAPVGTDGKVTLYNQSDSHLDLIADVSGYVLTGDPLGTGALGALAPQRLLDTRKAIGGPATAIGADQARSLTVHGRGGVPLASVSAVVLNVTVVSATAATGDLDVYAGGGARPTVSNLNFVRGQTVPNLVVAPVGSNGTVAIYNHSDAPLTVLADVAGYILDTDLSVPTVSLSRYVRNLAGDGTNQANNATLMSTEGCADAAAGSTLSLLDVGAQSITAPLSAGNPGVALTTTTIRLTYPELVTALQGYITGFNGCTTTNAVVAIGTNNDGTFSTYTAPLRGDDWANDVIDALTPASHVTIAGADDIEAGFASTANQAGDWEKAYLAQTSAGLIDNGSLDGCPTSYGSTANCSPWTLSQYKGLTHGNGVGRISVLPQVYLTSQAVQWANLDSYAGGALSFAGALTENAACGSSCSMTPAQGWAALYHAISTVVTTPSLPAVTDLMVS
jgi:hypothetical protein